MRIETIEINHDIFILVCIDCELAWADWSACEEGTRVRFQYIRVEKEGAGAECPELLPDSESQQNTL